MKVITRSVDQNHIVPPKKWITSKTVGCYVVKKLEFQTSSITGTVKSLHHLHWNTFSGFSACTEFLPRKQCVLLALISFFYF